MRRATVYFSGRVQGVGFRQSTQTIASKFDVTGFVKNEPDGQVLLCVEGLREEIARLLATIEERMVDNIHSRTIEWGDATGKWGSFSIDWT